MRGYSITLPRGEGAPAISFTDLKRRLLFCPLGDVMRISGFADFTGFDHRRDAERVDLLHSLAKSLAPHVADFAAADACPWAGSRPMTPDGRPLVGPTRMPGLFVNCGHGMLGWTLAAATASELADALVPDGSRSTAAERQVHA
ncbi:MAG: FAD-dependent oxidoreductase [Woeseiaceae bacterium]|nr:FAD-dependent oxidoreductase [Woeseiaceae bacterium]